MGRNIINCHLCGYQVDKHYPVEEVRGTHLSCRTCGTYTVSENAIQELASYFNHRRADPKRTWHWAAGIRDHNEIGIEPTFDSLEELDAIAPKEEDVLKSIDKVLLYTYRKAKASSVDEWVCFDFEVDYPIAFVKEPDGLEYVLEKAFELGYLEVPEYATDCPGWHVRLTVTGWEKVTALEKQQSSSNQAFIAMWFDSKLDDAFTNGIEPAIKACDYEPGRIDREEHNEKIDDRIISEIRKSVLLVADFTGQRGGVYFEAGFAMGLGIPVIWTCHEDDVENLHFDTRQYNHIVWKTAEDLKQKLQRRIEATLPNPQRDDHSRTRATPLRRGENYA